MAGSRAARRIVPLSGGQGVMTPQPGLPPEAEASPAGSFVSRSDRTWSQRTFSKVEAGSVRGSIFSLCCSAIGMGVLLLPYTMAQVGPLCSLALLAVAGAAAFASLRICCAGMQVANAHSYVDTLTAIFSERVAMVLTMMLVVACFGLCCGYFVFSSQLIRQLLQAAGVDCPRWLIVAVTACFPVFPLSLNKNLSDFRYLTLVSLAGLTYLTLLVVVRMPSYVGTNGLGRDWFWRVNDVSAVPKCLSLCFAAYTVHMNVFACYDELQNPTSNRIVKVLSRSAVLQSALYVSIALCGFLSFGLGTPDNILMAYSLHDMFVSFQLLLAVPLTVHPARTYLWALLGQCRRRRRTPTGSAGAIRLVPLNGGGTALASEAGEAEAGGGGAPPSACAAPPVVPASSRAAHVAVSAGIVGLAALVAAEVESASDLLGVVGGFVAVTYAYLLPAEMAKRLRNNGEALGIDWSASPAAFVAGSRGPLVIAGLRSCCVLSYIAAAQCAWNMVHGKA